MKQAEELTKAMLEPLGDVSAKAGKIERESPLFYGIETRRKAQEEFLRSIAGAPPAAALVHPL